MSKEFLNVNKAKKSLEKVFEEWNLSIDIAEWQKGFVVKSAINQKYYGNIGLDVFVSPSGLVSFYLYFGILKKNGQTLELVNEFNENVVGLKASIDCDNGMLTVSHETQYVTENTIGSYAESVLLSIVNNITLKYLQPLNELTVKD